MDRLISNFVTLKSGEGQLEDLSDPSSWGDVDENDPKSMARWMRRMEHAMGEDLGEDFDELAEMVEAGETPDMGSGDLNEEEHGHDHFNDDDF